MDTSNTIPNDATGDALRRYIQHGSDLTKPMVMDFFVAVPSQKAGDAVAIEAQKLGFKTQVEKDEGSENWTCYCTITMIPHYKDVVEVEEKLQVLATPHSGHIDGFGSYGNADD
ncbi:ribonuclease E inhibitor RraB [Planctomycetota bacterium]|nr:ribonuclease E inhibitor RraB [Planctomycetota bacterium]